MPLPPCHSRRDLPDDSKTYFCAHPQVYILDQLVTAPVCQVCVLRKQPAPAHFRPFDPNKIIRRNGPCVHLGGQIGWRPCQTCLGNVQLKVFSCSHPSHDSTTYDECSQCLDYVARNPDPPVHEPANGEYSESGTLVQIARHDSVRQPPKDHLS